MVARPSAAFVLIAALAGAVGVACAALAAPGVRERLEDLNLRETELNAEQGRNLNRISRLLSVLVQMKRDPPPALLVSPGDAKDAVRAAILVKAMTPELQRRARAYSGEAGEIARQRRLAAVASEAFFTTDSEEADHLRGQIITDASTPPAAPPVDDTPLTPPDVLYAPAPGPLIHGFGEKAIGGGKTAGLTIRTADNAQVKSPAGALVQYVGPVKGWGVILILKMPGGYHLVLAGLDRVTVGVGQSVAAGGPVGWMPDGRQSPSELYFEVRERGAPVDPGRWLRPNAGKAEGA